MELCSQLNLLRLIESCEEYSVFLENIEVIEEAFETERMYFAESKEDKNKAVKAADKYIKDVKKFVSEKISSADKYRKISKALTWLTLGSITLGPLIGIGVAAAGASASLATATALAKIGGVIYVMSGLVAVIASLISLITRDKANKEVIKLKSVKRRLEVYQEKVSYGKVQEELNNLIFQIEEVIDKVMDDSATERTVSRSM